MSDNNNKKVNPAERVALNITPDKKLFCNVCNQELLKDYSCGKCGIYYLPEQARHEVKIMGLDGKEPGPNATTIPHASIDTEPKKKPKMAPLFESLERSGFKFTSYSSTNE
jgi:hypothetical protein